MAGSPYWSMAGRDRQAGRQQAAGSRQVGQDGGNGQWPVVLGRSEGPHKHHERALPLLSYRLSLLTGCVITGNKHDRSAGMQDGVDPVPKHCSSLVQWQPRAWRRCGDQLWYKVQVCLCTKRPRNKNPPEPQRGYVPWLERSKAEGESTGSNSDSTQ